MTHKYSYKAKVVNIVDGDTFDMEVDLGFQMQANIRFRLKDFDTPEKYGRTSEAEKQHGYEAEAFARGTLLYKEVIINTFKNFPGIYGRWECEIFIDGVSYGEMLKQNDLLKRDNYE